LRVRVPMRGTGAEQLVVVRKARNGAGAKGLHSSVFAAGSTSKNGRNFVSKTKPFSISKQEAGLSLHRLT